jgi:glutaconate CoA-transferase subunit B
MSAPVPAAPAAEIRPEELLIHTLAGLLEGARHVAVGVLSPIPGAAAFLARERWGTRVTILGSDDPAERGDGGSELFDLAGQGRLDAFFLGGGQIDGQANINLTGIGDYPALSVRWPGAFGSAYLAFLVPRLILFREEHDRRVLVPRVDFVTAPGTSPPGVHRPGGPVALVTGRCVMRFDRARARFRLESVHPGQDPGGVAAATGFDFDRPARVPETARPGPADLALIRGPVAAAIGRIYPAFAGRVFGAAP